MELEHLLQEADVVSIHCPLTDKTRGLIGRAELEMMRSGVLVINYSRGEVLREEVRYLSLLTVQYLVKCHRRCSVALLLTSALLQSMLQRSTWLGVCFCITSYSALSLPDGVHQHAQ